MNRDDQRRLVRRVLRTRDAEPDYESAEAEIERYVDATIRGEDVSGVEALLQGHLDQSPETADVLETVKALARLEAEGALPSIDDLYLELRQPVAPKRSTERSKPLRSPTRQVRRDRSGFAWLTWWALPLAAAVAIAFTSTAWLRAERQSAAAASELAVLQSALASLGEQTERTQPIGLVSSASGGSCGSLHDTMAAAREVRFGRSDDGSWARVAFSPGQRRALVWLGGMRTSSGAGEYHCWLLGPDGSRHDLRILAHDDGETEWWHVEADRSWGEFDTLVMATEADGAPLMRVSLVDPDR